MKAKVTAVLFDYGLVLSGPPDPAAWETMKAILRMDEVEFHAAYWRPRHDYDRGALDGPAYWRAVACKVLSAEETAALIAADTELWTQANVPMIEWAMRLQRAGVKTGILSNLGDAMEAGVRAKFAWVEDFAHLTFSHRLGMAKPEAAIYLHAAEGLETAPGAILFIDDRADNIEGARAVGMQVMRYGVVEGRHEAFCVEMRAAGFGELLDLG